jgi:protein-disulfide isomerase
MASRKSEREARRQERLAAESEAAAAEARRRRLLAMVAGAVAVVAAVVVVLILVNSGGEEKAQRQQQAQHNLGFLDSLPQQGTVVGDPSAKVTLIEFEDLQCPVCAQFSQTEFEPLLRQVVAPGKAKLELRQWAIIGPDSKTATRGALAAAKQNRYLQFVDVFYANQGPENSGYVTKDFMAGVAQDAGLDVARWQRDYTSTDPTAYLQESDRLASRYGLDGTPSFVVVGPGGAQPTDARTATELAQAVAAAGS